MASNRGGKKMWCVPDLTPEYIERMEDLLDLYERPHDASEPVVCLDEKPLKLHGSKRPSHRARDASLRYDYEYRRYGTANLFVSVEPKAGRHFTKVTRTRHGREFAQMLREIAARYTRAAKIHLVVDNLSTHSLKVLRDALGDKAGQELWSRFEVHFTPKHGSWLNQAEIEIGCISRECIGRLRFDEIGPLRKQVRAWVRDANQQKRRINWRFRTSDARRKFRYARPTSTGR